MDSPGMNMVSESSKAIVGVADFLNQTALNAKGRKAEYNMDKSTMADSAFGVVENDPNAQGILGYTNRSYKPKHAR